MSILALGNWRRAMAPPSIVEFFLGLIVTEAITTASPSLRHSGHLGTKGCSFDFSAQLRDARQQALSPFLCQYCRSRIITDGMTAVLPAVDSIFNRSWLGSSADPSSPAGITSALGHDLFVIKGLKPTVLETIRATVRRDGFRQVLVLLQTILAAVLTAALLVYLGLRR